MPPLRDVPFSTKWANTDNTTMKTCNVCRLSRSVLEDFYWERDGGFQRPGSQCRTCNSIKGRKRRAEMPECQVLGCTRRSVAKGLCDMHYQRVKGTGELGPVEQLRGQGTITPDGYRKIYLKAEGWHKGHGHYELEHRFIMSQHLCRDLLRGQRVTDKLEWADYILELYGELFPEENGSI